MAIILFFLNAAWLIIKIWSWWRGRDIE
jgi:hypothetical protein